MDVYNQALQNGGPDTITKLRNKNKRYRNENDQLREDNQTLLDRIDRQKEKLSVFMSEGSMTKKDKEELYKTIDRLKEDQKEVKIENEDLRLKLVAKQLDLENLKKQIRDGSSTPLFFASDETRNDFWIMLTRH